MHSKFKVKLNINGSALVSLLVVAVIIGIIYYYMTSNIKTKTDNSTSNFINNAGVDTSSYKSILDSTKKLIDNAQATRMDTYDKVPTTDLK